MQYLTVAAALLLSLVYTAGGQRAGPAPVEPSCPALFGTPETTCFCARAQEDVWSVTCGCGNFPGQGDVLLTSRLLPSDDSSSLVLSVLGCQRRVRLSQTFLDNISSYADVTLDVRNTEQFVWDDATLQTSPLSVVSARFENVKIPRLPANFFSHRLSAQAEFMRVEIGEIPTGTFANDIVTPLVAIRESKVGRIASGAFAFPVNTDVISQSSNQVQLLVENSEISAWETDAIVGGDHIAVTGSRITRLATHALSFTGLTSLNWNNTQVEQVEPGAVYQHLSSGSSPVNQPDIVRFVNNTFSRIAASDTSITPDNSVGVIHFEDASSLSSLQFFNNTVLNSFSAPVTPDPRQDQVVGTRLQCRCDLLVWLSGTAFEEQATCAHEENDRSSSVSARQFLSSTCGSNSVDRSGPEPVGYGARMVDLTPTPSPTPTMKSNNTSPALRPTSSLTAMVGVLSVSRALFNAAFHQPN